MVKVAIIGGRLQGTEAVYLARKAGFTSVLIDRLENPPAKGMCSVFVQLDVCEKSALLLETLKSCDFILPAIENIEALCALRELKEEYNLNVAFDFDAYAISASKLRSDDLFHKHKIPAPRYYPEGQPPYIAKRSAGSGSEDVRLLTTETEASALYETDRGEWVVQEYLEGLAYSIEVIGAPGQYTSYQMTEIHVDKDYDCCLVTCPCPGVDAKALSAMAIQIAELIQLKGIMDLEVIIHEGEMKVLEIDARLPSQTPTAVLHSTGINLLSELHRLFCGDWTRHSGAAVFAHEKIVAYEHIKASARGIDLYGEGILAQSAPLYLYQNRVGAGEVLTDYKPYDSEVRATLINCAESLELLNQKRQAVWEAIAETMVVEKEIGESSL